MSRQRTAAGEVATRVILATFRANGLLVLAGDLLAAGEGLTSARWQVLGAVALAKRPLTVPQIARRMGLTRQSVHATINRLAADGLVESTPNADHQRSPLIRLTRLGQARYRAMQRRQSAWVDQLVDGLSTADLETTARVLGELCQRLEAGRTEGDDAHG